MPSKAAARTLAPTEVEEIQRILRAEKDRIIAEIRTYPPPIPACDAQYNYLVEQRSVVTLAMNRAGALAVAAASGDIAAMNADRFWSTVGELAPEVQDAIWTSLA